MKIQDIPFIKAFFFLILTVFVLPKTQAQQNVTINGDNSIVVNTQKDYNVYTSASSYYWWISGSGGQIIGDNTSSSVTVEATSFNNFTLWVQLNNYQYVGSKAITVICNSVGTPTTSVNQPTCTVPTGSITVTNFSESNHTFSFDNGATYQTSKTKSNLSPGTTYYTKVKRLSDGCVSSTKSVAINPVPSAPSEPTVTGSSVREICLGQATTFSISNPSGTYQWFEGSTSLGSGSSKVITPTSAGKKTYTIIVTDGNGCTNSNTVEVNVIDLEAPLNNSPFRDCNSTSSVTLSAVSSRTINGDSKNIAHRWYQDSSLSNFVTPTTVQDTPNGTHVTTMTFTLQVGESRSYWVTTVLGGCESPPTEVTGEYMDYSVDGGQISAPSPSTICYGISPNIITNSTSASGGEGVITYRWEYSDDGNIWTQISNTNVYSYNPPETLLDDRWYRRRATSCGSYAYSNVVTVSVKDFMEKPALEMISQTTCSSPTGSFRIENYNGALSYSVSPSTGVVQISGDVVTTYQGTYSVIATSNGCSSEASDPIQIFEQPFVPGTPLLPTIDDSICGEVTLTRDDPNNPNEVTWYWQDTEFGTNNSINNTAHTITLYSGSVYYLRAQYNQSECWGESRAIPYQIVPFPDIPVGPTEVIQCGGSENVTLVATPGQNGDIVRWYDVASEGQSLHEGNLYIVPPSNQDRIFYAETYNSNEQCSSQQRLKIDVVIRSLLTWYVDNDGDNVSGGSVQSCEDLSLLDPPYKRSVDGHNDCDDDNPNILGAELWYPDTDGDGLRNPSGGQFFCDDPTEGTWTQGLIVDICPEDFDPTNECSSSFSSYNYVYSRTYQTPHSSQLDPDFFTDDQAFIQEITYFDGLGRPNQMIGINQSPNNEDIVTHKEYDSYGREKTAYLPYAETDNAIGIFRISAKSLTSTFYGRLKYENTSNPYSEKHFEPSPLNRVKQQAAPGNDWALGQGHEIEFDYETNVANEVRLFEVTFDDDGNGNDDTEKPNLSKNGFYDWGKLYKNVTRDENHTGTGKNHSSEEFTNKQGQIVLKRTYGPVDFDKDGNTTDLGEPEVIHDTYYVYDDFGNLTYVLPPLVDTSTTIDQTTLDNLCYQYVYDHRNRLVEKKIPGKGWEYIVYNKLDQPIMTQDANQRDTGTDPHEWLFTKYDAFGRVAYTGKATCATSVTRTDLQNEVDGLTENLWVKYDHETNFGGTDIFYDNGAYPHNGTLAMPTPHAQLTEILSINYYDDYDAEWAEIGVSVTAFGITSTSNINGLATGSKVKVLDVPGPNVWITTTTYYDEKARPIYTHSRNEYLSTVDIVTSKLDFVGRPLQVRSEHSRGSNTVVTLDTFTYDHVGRLKTQTQCIGDTTLGENCPLDNSLDENVVWDGQGNITDDMEATESIVIRNATILPGPNGTVLRIVSGSVEELIVSNTYDELGQLEGKSVGGDASGNGLQTVNYDYNVRGWLTGINNETGDNQGIGMDSKDLFGFQINYNDPHNFGTNENPDALYNGNISQILWQTASVDTGGEIAERYSFAYDALNRINMATDNTTSNHYGLEFVTFDQNGNIQRLKRNGHTDPGYSVFGTMDDLVYAYTGNQLTSLADNSLINFGFSDGEGSNMEYRYDPNGNMVADLNKKIGTDLADGIVYNLLNMPVSIEFTNSGSDGNIGYVYDAIGNKLQKTVSPNGQGSTTTDYAGNFIYENSTLKQFSHAEGYVEVNGNGDYDYVYSYLDHLGTVRLTYSDFNGNGTIEAATEILRERNTYPFGLEHKGYNNLQNGVESNYQTYLGQEMNKELGLNWLTFRYRNYDPTIGRFFGADPISEEFLSISNYQFAHNNPIWKIELEGLEGATQNGEIDIPNDEPVTGNTGVGTTLVAIGGNAPTTEIRSGLFNDNDFQGAFTPATDVQYDFEPVIAFLKDVSYIGLTVMGLDAVDNTTATVADPDVPTGAKVSAVLSTLPAFIRGSKGKGTNSAATVPTPMTSRAARRQVMRNEGIPTSQQSSSQSKNASGREYTYTVPKKGGGTQKKSVQQQTKDRNHDKPHWEAGMVKMDNTRVRMNQYKRPKLTNNKSKVEYDE